MPNLEANQGFFRVGGDAKPRGGSRIFQGGRGMPNPEADRGVFRVGGGCQTPGIDQGVFRVGGCQTQRQIKEFSGWEGDAKPQG